MSDTPRIHTPGVQVVDATPERFAIGGLLSETPSDPNLQFRLPQVLLLDQVTIERLLKSLFGTEVPQEYAKHHRVVHETLESLVNQGNAMVREIDRLRRALGLEPWGLPAAPPKGDAIERLEARVAELERLLGLGEP